ncbi:hypothetical protein BDF20DRAFT_874297 [Mycotypha africana]|uniref:uncharacterized protein n=1 Tax=Mycotypha africana TaxID=64632 RepID=UPI002300933B|nr:uncharacterized protein BDF20DRAFT_874297 [Mycotypha africana]KAI8977349.1 hypothetical protein BDF20DRAFT_874297 [Mycotypha africana]
MMRESSSQMNCNAIVDSNQLWQTSTDSRKQTTSDIDKLIQKDHERLQQYVTEKEQNEQLKRTEKGYHFKQFYNHFNSSINKISSSSSLSFKKNTKSSSPVTPLVALTESRQAEVFKLSVIDQNGTYEPPSPPLSSNSKRDHWVEVYEEDIMDFWLPSRNCLTVQQNENKHEFFTPSTIVPYSYHAISISQTPSKTCTVLKVPPLKESCSTSTIASRSSAETVTL